jgi:hypothetical protein
MSVENQQAELREGEVDSSPKPLTAAQNVVLTLKILAIAAILLGLFWVFELMQG